MKAGWVTKRLGDVAKTQYGLSEPMNEVGTGFKIFRMGEVQDGRLIDTGRMKFANISQKEFEQYKLRPGDVLFNRTNSFELVGKTGIFALTGDYCFASYLVRLNLDRKTVLPEFLNYFMNSDRFQKSVKEKASRSINQANINATILSNELISFPESLPEQQRIVGILDVAFDGIATAKANAERNLQNARALFESHLQSVFTQRGEGWDEKPLAELCDIKHGFAFKSEFFTNKGDYILLTPGNFYESGGYRDRGEKQKYYCGDFPRSYVLEQGDLLVAMTEQAAGLLGSPILVPESNKFLHNQRLGLVIKKPGVPLANEFFFHVFNTRYVRKEIHDSASGVKVRHTSPTKIGEVIVSFPTSVAEQMAIVSKLNDLDEETQRLESIYQQKLAALDELKKSLLHQAFTGQL